MPYVGPPLTDLNVVPVVRSREIQRWVLVVVFPRRVRRPQIRDRGEDRRLAPTSSPCLSSLRSKSSRRYTAVFSMSGNNRNLTLLVVDFDQKRFELRK